MPPAPLLDTCMQVAHAVRECRLRMQLANAGREESQQPAARRMTRAARYDHAPRAKRIHMTELSLNVNGETVAVEIEPTLLLLDLLRGPLALTGTHSGCDTAQCGACTVLLDDKPVKSCSLLALQAQGQRVTTVEGLASAQGQPHPLQEAFMVCHGLQCGFCTPGMLMAASGLLKRNPLPSEAQVVDALEGNLCRCTGYVNIVMAVQQAARVMASGGGAQ